MKQAIWALTSFSTRFTCFKDEEEILIILKREENKKKMRIQTREIEKNEQSIIYTDDHTGKTFVKVNDKIYPVKKIAHDHLQEIWQFENGELIIAGHNNISKKYASWEDYINRLKNDIEKLEFNFCMESFPEKYKGRKDFQQFLNHQNNQRQLWLEDISQSPRKIGNFVVTQSWWNAYKYIPARKKIEVKCEAVFDEIDIIALKKATGTDDISKAIMEAVEHYLLQQRFDTEWNGYIDNLYNEVEHAEAEKQNRNGRLPRHPSD